VAAHSSVAPSSGALLHISTTTASGSANTWHITTGSSSTDHAFWIIGAKFIEENFYIAERAEFPNPKQITLEQVYEHADFCGNFDTITIDAFNQLENVKQLPLHEFVNEIGHTIKNHDRDNKQSTFMVVHGQETQHILKSGAAPYPNPVASNALHGGKNWEKFADMIVQVYVPPRDAFESDYEYPALIMIQKVREDDSGKKGVVVLGWCPKRQKRYYEMIDGRKCYGGDYLKPNTASQYFKEHLTRCESPPLKKAA